MCTLKMHNAGLDPLLALLFVLDFITHLFGQAVHLIVRNIKSNKVGTGSGNLSINNYTCHDIW
jgi:hypothetical protein